MTRADKLRSMMDEQAIQKTIAGLRIARDDLYRLVTGGRENFETQAITAAIFDLQELQQYRQIGTLEECREAREMQKCLQEHGIESQAVLVEEMRRFKRLKKHEMQYLDKIDDPLVPLKISSALDSEIMKLEYRKEHKPKSISVLDYTIISALMEALERRTGEDETDRCR